MVQLIDGAGPGVCRVMLRDVRFMFWSCLFSSQQFVPVMLLSLYLVSFADDQ